MGHLPANLERTADAGGWEERQAERAMEFMEKASKIKEKEWKAMTGTLGALKGIVEAGGLEGMFDNLKETWSLQVADALSPLTNEINQAVSEALKPIMPQITAVLNEASSWISVSVGSWEAVFTNEWDAVFKDISAKMPDWMKEFKNNFNQWLYDLKNDLSARTPYIGVGGARDELSAMAQNIATWQNDVQQGWYDFWSSLGW